MLKPNWFDEKYEAQLESATADEAIQLVAKDKKVREAVAEALRDRDENAGKKGWVGPSRTQAVRTAIADALSAD